MRWIERFTTCLLLLAVLTACTSATKGEDAALDKTVIASCPVTVPNGKSPAVAGASGFNLGNEGSTLYTIPWPEGTVIFAIDGSGKVLPDGSLEMKWHWWRGVRGALTIHGRRLDAHAPPLRADVTEGYGDQGFLSTGLIFPTQGCWEVTGMVGNARLTFVTLVIKVPFRLIFLNWVPREIVSTKYDTSKLPDSLREIESFSGGGEVIMESAVNQQAMIAPDHDVTQQHVTVQGHPGICVEGALINQQWQDSVDAGFLQWTEDDTSYRISHRGLGLRCEDLLSMVDTS